MEISKNARQSIVNDSGAAIVVQPGQQAEIELKLLAPQGALERLREMPFIVQHARNRGAFRRLETVYYDTPEHLLFQHGMSLRVRRSGKHFIQTLKLLPKIGQPLTRRQWEAPVDGVTPDLARLPAGEIGDPVTTLTNDALVPVFGGTRGSSICPMRRSRSHSTRGRSRPVRVRKCCPKSNSN